MFTGSPRIEGHCGISSGYDHSTLYINNVERGPAGESNTIVDYSDLSEEEGHTWILKCESGKKKKFHLCKLLESVVFL